MIYIRSDMVHEKLIHWGGGGGGGVGVLNGIWTTVPYVIHLNSKNRNLHYFLYTYIILNLVKQTRRSFDNFARTAQCFPCIRSKNWR